MLETYIIDFLNSIDYSSSIYTNDSSCHYCYKLKVCLTESSNLTNFDGSAALGNQVCVCSPHCIFTCSMTIFTITPWLLPIQFLFMGVNIIIIIGSKIQITKSE